MPVFEAYLRAEIESLSLRLKLDKFQRLRFSRDEKPSDGLMIALNSANHPSILRVKNGRWLVDDNSGCEWETQRQNYYWMPCPVDEEGNVRDQIEESEQND